jgi:hypothetical protein
MPLYSASSVVKLNTCDPRLQKIFNEVIKRFDHTVLEGHRGKEAQDAAHAAGKSKLKWPNGKHNSLPSKAIDVVPVEYSNGKVKIDWNDVKRICYFAGIVMATAQSMGIGLRWGGDWDQDTELKDNSFNDLVHFELTED